MSWTFSQLSTSNPNQISQWNLSFPNEERDFSAPFVLARILEGGTEPGVLTDFIRRGGVHPPSVANQQRNDSSTVGGVGRVDPAPTLQSAIASLAPDQKKILAEQVGDHLCKFLSLSEQSSPKIFYDELYQLGRELENSDRLEMATAVYTAIVGAGSTRPSWHNNQETILPSTVALGQVNPAPTEIQQKAKERLEILQGGGSVGTQLDFFGRRLVQRVLEPSGMLGMAFGLGVSQFTEALALNKLISYGFTRGLSTRVAAGLFGFAAEVPGITLGGKFTRSLLGHQEDYSSETIKQELKGGIALFGSMKIFAIGGGLLTREMTALPGSILRQAANLAGIMMGEEIKIASGMERYHGFSNFMVNSLTILFEQQAMGEVTNSLLGARYKLFQQRISNFEPPHERMSKFQNFIEQWRNGPGVLTLAEATAGASSDILELLNTTRYYTTGRIAGGTRLKYDLTELRQKLGPLATPKVVKILETIAGTLYPSDHLFAAIGNTQIHHPQKFEMAMTRLQTILNWTAPDLSYGSYFEYMVTHILHDATYQSGPMDIDPILTILCEGGKVRDLEATFAKDSRLMEALSLPADAPMLQNFPKLWRSIDRLPLSPSHKNLLRRFAEKFVRSLDAEHYHYADRLQEKIASMEAILAWPDYIPWVDKIFDQALQSPMASLRIARLLNVANMEHKLTLIAKLAELADTEAHIYVHGVFSSWQRGLGKIDGTQYSAYLKDQEITGLMRKIYLELPFLLNPELAKRRAARTDKILSDFIATWDPTTPLRMEDVTQLLEQMGDSFSKRAARDFREGKVGYNIVDEMEFSDLVKEVYRHHDFEKKWNAFYSPPGRYGQQGMIFIKKPNFPSANPTELKRILVLLLSRSIHEHNHFLQDHPLRLRTYGVAVREEIASHALGHYWEALHGNTTELSEALYASSGGIALHLRHRIENSLGPNLPNRGI